MPKKRQNKKTSVEKKEKPLNKKQNKIFRNVLIAFGVVILVFLIGYIVIYNMSHFTYKGVYFEVVKFCDAEPCLVLYQTKLPVITSEGIKAEYNFYLRNNPRDLEDIEFDGDINLMGNMVIDSHGDFNCNGDGIIAVANLVKLYEIIGTKVVKNQELDCSLGNEYIYLDIQEGETTRVVQAVNSCYVLRVNNCEILPVTEKFMLETLIKVNNELL